MSTEAALNYNLDLPDLGLSKDGKPKSEGIGILVDMKAIKAYLYSRKTLFYGLGIRIGAVSTYNLDVCFCFTVNESKNALSVSFPLPCPK